jgi:hypothetical protein
LDEFLGRLAADRAGAPPTVEPVNKTKAKSKRGKAVQDELARAGF